MEGAREVTMHWAAHVPRPKPQPDCQDFRKINKMAAKDGIAGPKSFAQYRRGHDVKLLPTGPAGALPTVIPSDVIPSFAYGKKSRPSTPIAAVVAHQYQTEAEEALEDSYRQYEALGPSPVLRVQLTKSSSRLIAQARSTKSLLLENNSQPKELFKLTKFKKVPSRLGMHASASLPAIATQKLPPIVMQKGALNGDELE